MFMTNNNIMTDEHVAKDMWQSMPRNPLTQRPYTI